MIPQELLPSITQGRLGPQGPHLQDRQVRVRRGCAQRLPAGRRDDRHLRQDAHGAHAGVRHLLPQSGHWQAVAPGQTDQSGRHHGHLALLPTTVMRNLRKWRVPMENYGVTACCIPGRSPRSSASTTGIPTRGVTPNHPGVGCSTRSSRPPRGLQARQRAAESGCQS